MKGGPVTIIASLRRLLILTPALLLAFPAWAEPGAALGTLPDREGQSRRILTLPEAVSLAMRDNPGLRAMRSALRARQSEVGSARSPLLPHIRIEERFSRTDNPMYAFGTKLNQSRITQSDFNPAILNSPDAIEDFQTSVTVEQAIYAPGAYTGLRMAKEEALATEYDLARKQEEVTMDVIRAYMNMITARSYMDVAEKALGDSTEHHRIALARHKAGLGLYSDTLRTEVAVREAEEMRLKAEKGVKLAGLALSMLVGLDEPVEAAAAVPEFNVLALDEYLLTSRDRSDLRAMQKRADNAASGIKAANAGYLPMLGLGASWQLNSEDTAFGSDAESYSVAAFMRWDFYDGGKRRAERQKAIARRGEAREMLDGLRKQVAFSVHQAYLEMEEAEQGLELAEARLALAEESQRLIASRFENSLSRVVELMDAQSALNAARAGVVEKRNNYSIAAAELMYQSGTIMGLYEKEAGGDR